MKRRNTQSSDDEMTLGVYFVTHARRAEKEPRTGNVAIAGTAI
jgi:hypothetical protein